MKKQVNKKQLILTFLSVAKDITALSGVTAPDQKYSISSAFIKFNKNNPIITLIHL